MEFGKGDCSLTLIGAWLLIFAMSEAAKKDPMHGKTLSDMLTELVESMGWEELASRISINCFANDPSIKSSLNFLRKTHWARAKVESVYRESIGLKPLAKKPPREEKPERHRVREDLLPSRRPFTPKGPKLNPWTGKPLGEE